MRKGVHDGKILIATDEAFYWQSVRHFGQRSGEGPYGLESDNLVSFPRQRDRLATRTCRSDEDGSWRSRKIPRDRLFLEKMQACTYPVIALLRISELIVGVEKFVRPTCQHYF
jgi:hypothetical protein